MGRNAKTVVAGGTGGPVGRVGVKVTPSRDAGTPRLDTILAQAGGFGLGLCPGTGVNHGDTTGSIIPPIYPSTTYSRDTETYQPRWVARGCSEGTVFLFTVCAVDGAN